MEGSEPESWDRVQIAGVHVTAHFWVIGSFGRLTVGVVDVTTL